jgi:hypothetical protein
MLDERLLGSAVSLENAASIGWKVNSAGTRFGIGRTNAGLLFFRTSAELGTTSGGPLYDLKVDNSGNVGIGNLGISTPIEQRMTVFTSSGTYGFAHTDGTVTLSSFVDSTGGWLGTRSNHPLHFYTNNGAAIMTIGANGNIGIGTAPGGVTKLIIAGNVATFGDLSNGFAQAGSTSVCRNGTIFAACSSSLRYKTDVQPFTEGMKYINDLQPIVFTWKIDGARDIGFGAEDVEKIDPLFVTYNDKKQVEGVKYDRLSVAFVNAFKEQQSQIEKQQTTIQLQQKQIDEQRRQIEALMRVVCSQTNEPTVCRHP